MPTWRHFSWLVAAALARWALLIFKKGPMQRKLGEWQSASSIFSRIASLTLEFKRIFFHSWLVGWKPIDRHIGLNPQGLEILALCEYNERHFYVLYLAQQGLKSAPSWHADSHVLAWLSSVEFTRHRHLIRHDAFSYVLSTARSSPQKWATIEAVTKICQIVCDCGQISHFRG